MKKLTLNLFLLVFCFSVSAPVLQGQTADEIIDKYFEVTGGKENWKKVSSVEMRGTAKMQNMEFPMYIVMKRPHKVYQEVSFNDMKIISAFDGTIGWKVNPMMASGAPTKMEPAEIKQFESQKVEDELLDYKANGMRASYEGIELIAGAACYKIKIARGDQEYYVFFDKETNLKVMQRGKVESGDAAGKFSDTYVSFYKDVEGLKYPFILSTKIDDQIIFTAEMTTIELNKEVKDDLFEYTGKD